MNDKTRAAMQMALEALEKADSRDGYYSYDIEITALREALAQPQDNLNCKSVQARLATSWGYVKEQPQGEWVDLTDDDFNAAFKKHPNDFARAVIAKFKEKNTPPVVPQGEPVAWYYKQTHVYLQNAGDVVYIERVVDKPQSWEEHPLYFAPLSVEAAIEATKENESKVYHRLVESAVAHAIEATKEKAARVCDAEMDDWAYGGEASIALNNCSAAIRGMK